MFANVSLVITCYCFTIRLSCAVHRLDCALFTAFLLAYSFTSLRSRRLCLLIWDPASVLDMTWAMWHLASDTRRQADTLWRRDMGGKSSKSDDLSRADMDWLVKHTKYNEDTIQEWYKGFRNSDSHLDYKSELSCFYFSVKTNFSKCCDIWWHRWPLAALELIAPMGSWPPAHSEKYTQSVSPEEM